MVCVYLLNVKPPVHVACVFLSKREMLEGGPLCIYVDELIDFWSL